MTFFPIELLLVCRHMSMCEIHSRLNETEDTHAHTNASNFCSSGNHNVKDRAQVNKMLFSRFVYEGTFSYELWILIIIAPMRIISQCFAPRNHFDVDFFLLHFNLKRGSRIYDCHYYICVMCVYLFSAYIEAHKMPVVPIILITVIIPFILAFWSWSMWYSP